MYGTIAQLEDRITTGILAQRITETGSARTRVLTSYLTAASAVMDAYICTRYATPAPTSPLLDHIALSIALWNIEADRGSAFAADKLPPSVQVPYDEAMALLAKISSGDLQLKGADAPAQSNDAAAGLAVVSHDPVFAPDSPGMEFF